MEYLSLYKAGFINDIDEHRLYDDRFHAANTIHIPMDIGQNPAFLYLNSELMALVEQIQSLNSQIIRTRLSTDAPLMNVWEAYHSLVEEICLSNEIEGVVSTRQEIRRLLDEEEMNRYRRLYGMVNLYRKLFFGEFEQTRITTVSDVRKLYDELLLEDIEKEDPMNVPDGLVFRKNSVSVMSGTKSIHEGLYPESRIIQAMETALSILNDPQLPSLVRVALFHYLFGYIHPFYDGNGRISRYISSLYLCEYLDPIVSLHLSNACHKRKKDYYRAFRITSDPRNRGDLTFFVMTFLDIFKEGLQDYLQEITEKAQQYTYYRKVRESLDLDRSASLILKEITEFTLFYLRNTDVKELCEVTGLSRSTVSLKIGILEKKGYITRYRQGRRTEFSFNPESM